MPVLRDWNCKAHGVFESSDPSPRCPKGCNAVEPIFLRAPAVRTNGRTKRIDSTLTELAADFGLTDLSTRNGSVMNSIRNHSKPDHVARSYDNLYSPLAGMGGGAALANMLQPRFASPNEVAPMLEPGGRAPYRGLNGIGDELHNRMGPRNIDRQLTVVEAQTSKDDDAKLQQALQGQVAA